MKNPFNFNGCQFASFTYTNSYGEVSTYKVLLGASYENAIDEYKNELGYISLPVLLKIYLSDSFSLDVGPQASFLLNKKDEFNTIIDQSNHQ